MRDTFYEAGWLAEIGSTCAPPIRWHRRPRRWVNEIRRRGASGGVSRRASLFSYACNRCRLCCYGKGIRVNPYEVLRLARRRGISTTEFLKHYTGNGGIELARTADEACVFLGPEACTVHPDRPLVCRLYPLGRRVSQDDEVFFELTPHPETKGVYGKGATVQDFLEAQGAEPFIDAARRYAELRQRLAATLPAAFAAAPELEAEARATAESYQDGGDPGVPELLDIDAMVRQHCLRHKVKMPRDVKRLMGFHIMAVEEFVESLSEKGRGA